MTTATQQTPPMKYARQTQREALNDTLHNQAFLLFGVYYEIFINTRFNDYFRVENKGVRVCEGGLQYCVDILAILLDDKRNPSPLPF